jgi:hypothetical protein
LFVDRSSKKPVADINIAVVAGMPMQNGSVTIGNDSSKL